MLHAPAKPLCTCKVIQARRLKRRFTTEVLEVQWGSIVATPFGGLCNCPLHLREKQGLNHQTRQGFAQSPTAELRSFPAQEADAVKILPSGILSMLSAIPALAPLLASLEVGYAMLCAHTWWSYIVIRKVSSFVKREEAWYGFRSGGLRNGQLGKHEQRSACCEGMSASSASCCFSHRFSLSARSRARW